jgi:hypothetical protein
MNRTAHIRMCTASLLVVAACTKGDAPRTDTSAARPLAGANAPAAASRIAAKQLPGALTKPLDSYTGDELYAFVQALSFTGDSVRERKCKNDPTCVSAPKQKKVKVGVAAVVGQDSLSTGTTPQYGVVYVRATNMGDAEEARYGMKPGKQLQFYVVVLPDSARGMQWRLEQLDTRAGARAHTSIGTGVFKGCGHLWTPGARADFSTCEKSASRKDSVVKLGLQLQGSDEDPIWVKCSMGCCEVASS